jgi:hypothetical protein
VDGHAHKMPRSAYFQVDTPHQPEPSLFPPNVKSHLNARPSTGAAQ